MDKYIFHASAVASHFKSTDGKQDFGHEYSVLFHSNAPHEHHTNLGGRDGREVTFADSFVHVSFKQQGGVYTTIARSGVKKLSVKGVITADSIEGGIMTVYREEWYTDPNRPRRARILPLPPVIENLQVSGLPYRLGQELKLPEAFHYDEASRQKYFLGEGPEIEPVGISTNPGRRATTKRGVIRFSADTRRITIPEFGIVYFADWTWQPTDIHTPAKTAQQVQLVRYDLKNPGSGSSSTSVGNGTPFGKQS
jgi:hypothetical protein